MKYAKSTLEYLFVLERGKRFALLFATALPFGMALAFTLDGGVFVRFLAQFTESGGTFGEIWNNGMDAGMFALRAAVAGVLLPPTLAFLAGYVSSKLRTGAFRGRWAGREMNYAMLPALFLTAAYVLFFLLLRVVFTLLTTLWGGVSATWLEGTLIAAGALFSYLPLFAVARAHVSYLPLTVVSGVNPLRALVTAFARPAGRGRERTLGIFLPFCLKAGASAALGMIEIRMIGCLLDGVLNAAFLVYLVAFSFVAYYESEGLERGDYTKEYYFRKVK